MKPGRVDQSIAKMRLYSCWSFDWHSALDVDTAICCTLLTNDLIILWKSPERDFHRSCVFVLVILATLPSVTNGVAPELQFHDKQPQRYQLKARASEIDPRAKPHPEIEFVFDRDGKPQGFQNAAVDTRVAPQGKLVIWLMGNTATI